MNLESLTTQVYYELLPVGAAKGRQPLILKKKRLLIGRSQACDVVIGHSEITAIHAVIELYEHRMKVYDMNSRNGTYINGRKIIVDSIKVGDTLKFGPLEFELRKHEAPLTKPALPGVISGGPKTTGSSSGGMSNFGRGLPKHPSTHMPIPPVSVQKDLPPSTPTLPEAPGHEQVMTESYPDLPEVVYPLAQDPNAEFSEYIFEDADIVFPIFKYDFQRTAVEIIILYKDKIHSVDYLPKKDGLYRLVGQQPSAKEVEYPYLGKKDKVDFVEVRGNEVFVNPLPGYEVLSLKDQKEKSGSAIHLSEDEIVRFSNGDLQIFVRPTESPPYVKPAPIFRRDGDLKKYLFIIFLLSFAFMTGLSLFQVDEELEQEKVPERVATILYQRKVTVSPNPAVDKTPDKPKEIVQKSPQQTKPVEQQAKPEVQQEQKSEAQARPGNQAAKSTEEARKAEANKGPQDRQRDQVRPTPQRPQRQASRPTQTQSQQQARTNSAAKGNVQTYQTPDFSSTVSSLVARGGATRAAEAQASSATAREATGVVGGAEGATLRRAEVSNNVGSLSGSARGQLDETRGAEGVVSQRNIYTAGLPFKEVVLGGMDPDTIRRILIDNIPQFRRCYQRELDKAPNEFDGVVRLDFIIGASGHVTRAGVQSASDSLPVTVRQCVVNVLRGIKFPEPLGGGVVEVNQPFNFYPRRQ